MNASIPNPAELQVTHDGAKAHEAVVAALNSAFVLEPIRVRESTLTPVMERLFQFRPTSHWGINE